MDIQLVKWDDFDPNELASMANNKAISDTLRDIFPYPYTVQDAKNWISSQKNIFPVMNFAITTNDKLVGGIGCNPLPDVNRKCMEIGYWICMQYRNQGIATKAVNSMTEYMFATFDIVRIIAPVFEINKASMKVLEKAGYHLEAIHKNAVFKNDIFMDEYLYVKLK